MPLILIISSDAKLLRLLHVYHLLLRLQRRVHCLLHRLCKRPSRFAGQNLGRTHDLSSISDATDPLTAIPASGSIQYCVPAAPPHPTLPVCLSPGFRSPRCTAIPVLQSASPVATGARMTMLIISAMAVLHESGSVPVNRLAREVSDRRVVAGRVWPPLFIER